MLQVAIESSLVNGHDRPKAHRHRGGLPKVRHEPGMRIRRQPAARVAIRGENSSILFRGEAAFEKGTRINTRRAACP